MAMNRTGNRADSAGQHGAPGAAPAAPRALYLNREGWLTELSHHMRPLFQGFTLGKYRLTCGWPHKNGLGRRYRRIGECIAPVKEDGWHDIFISPLLADSLEVAGTTAHEIVHVAAGVKAGHGKRFVQVARHVGLTKGKPTTADPGPALEEKLRRIIERLGPYPHTAVQMSGRKTAARKTAASLACLRCGCKVSISLKWLTQAGPPVCGCGGLFCLPPDDPAGPGD